MKRILITGGAGFIGSNLAAFYLRKNKKVLLYDDLSRQRVNHNLNWIKKIKKGKLTVVVEDIRNFNKLKKEVT
ncbi:GDP-mannose 4,6-dehydratase, partial [Patescibacteria group bacterium]